MCKGNYMKQLILGLALGLSVSGLIVAAQETTTHDMNGMEMSGVMTPASMAFAQAEADMMASMAITYTGDADVDFITGMIPHHQGAVEMAKIVLQYGSDPEVKALAEGIIAAQESEIAWMTGWLAALPM